ncbi:hypothetical protein [Rugosibacter aromaticivorans]|uniref:hypothetical protein n=1 Tax=Rugosibacter aromaticivorans TaxID=1565605 RepID=UPI000AE04995
MSKRVTCKFTRAGCALTLIFALPAWALPRDEIVSTAADQAGIAVTIYNDNLALVKDARRVKLAHNLIGLARGVSPDATRNSAAA